MKIFKQERAGDTATLLQRLLIALVTLVLMREVARAQTLTTLYTFSSAVDQVEENGEFPMTALTQASDGNFYGTTTEGGPNGAGTFFRITPTGTLTTLYAFYAPPSAPLALGNDGNFYGTTNVEDSVFQLTPDGTFTTLHIFDYADGAVPLGGLVLGTDGNFYGTTSLGGTEGFGTVFKIGSDGTFMSLYSFGAVLGGGDGDSPRSALIRGTDGNFYGTTNSGGSQALGTIFRITPSGALTTLYNLGSAPTDGQYPVGALVLGRDANYYGTTQFGGSGGLGTVFSVSTTGVFHTIYSFSGLDGAGLLAGVTLDSSGDFCGLTVGGGTDNIGTAFELTPGGILTTLHDFTGSDGSSPYGGLTLGADGKLYGTTSDDPEQSGGAAGTVFSLSIGGTSAPSISPAGVVDAASYSTSIAPGSLITVFGTFPIANPSSSSSFPIPTSIDGVSVEFGTGLLAPMFYGGANQVNAQIPWELSGQSQTTVTAISAGQSSSLQTIAIAGYAPGIFVVNNQTNQGAVLDAQYRLVSPTNPAVPGGYIQIYCTGLGPVTNQPATGSPARSDPLSATTLTPIVTIGGLTADVAFAGLAPGEVGLYQINAQVPTGATSGAAEPLVVSMQGAVSNTATIAIQ